MSNGERGRKLLAASREHLAEMEGALRRSSWNIAVRRAQEVVELALKAVLTYLCIDYPKVHDAADLFVATLAARQMGLSEVEAADVHAVSARLAERRAPAFYFEYDEEPAGARRAAADARRIQLLCTRIAADIERAAARGGNRLAMTGIRPPAQPISAPGRGRVPRWPLRHLAAAKSIPFPATSERRCPHSHCSLMRT